MILKQTDEAKLKVLEKGMIVEANAKGMSFSQWLEDWYVNEKKFEPTPYYGLTNIERVRMKMAARAAGKIPEASALDIIMKAHNITVNGPTSDRVGKFFEFPSSAVLYPEFISNKVFASMIMNAVYAQMIAETIVIKGMDFKRITLVDAEVDRQTRRTVAGAEFPTTIIKVADVQNELKLYGRTIEVPYKAIENTPIAIYGLFISRFGQQLGVDKTDDLILSLLNGDGNSNGLSGTYTVSSISTTAVTKDDIIALASALTEPYQLTVAVAQKAVARKFWGSLSDMQNPALQWGQTGLPLPKLYCWDRSALTSDLILGVDKNVAAAEVTNDTAMLMEVDRIITQQIQQTVVSTRSTFVNLDQKGIGALDVDHA